MGSDSATVVSGVLVRALPILAGSCSAMAVAGAGVATGNVAWAGNTKGRSLVSWMPSPRVALVDSGGLVAPSWYRFFEEIVNRLGNFQGPTLGEVHTALTATQTEVVKAGARLATVVVATNAAVDAINSSTATLVADGTPGASAIPHVAPVLQQ